MDSAHAASAQPTMATPATTDERPVLAVFDFDGTLTTGDSLGAFLHRQLGTLGWVRVLLQQSPRLLAYALGLMPNHQAKASLLQQALNGCTDTALADTADQLVQTWLPRHLNHWALDELQTHQQAGHTCVLLSASLDVYLGAVAKALAIPHLICTTMEMQDGRCTGRMVTPNCHGEEKWRRLQAWFTQQGQARDAWELHAYGDTRGDIPVLRQADQAWLRGRPWRA
jgi:phosphatidylglycerophosphatase C